jgi:hypothetical protein
LRTEAEEAARAYDAASRLLGRPEELCNYSPDPDDAPVTLPTSFTQLVCNFKLPAVQPNPPAAPSAAAAVTTTEPVDEEVEEEEEEQEGEEEEMYEEEEETEDEEEGECYNSEE